MENLLLFFKISSEKLTCVQSIQSFFATRCNYVFLICLLAFSRAEAATYPVSNYSALTTAISSALDGDTISITSDIVVTAQVSITKGLTFNGNNYTLTVPIPGVLNTGLLAGSPSTFRVFNISASGKIVVFNNIIIKGGSTTTSGGAMAIATGTTVFINRSTISNSRSASGGGVYNQGTCYLTYSNISRNAANFGGGFLNASGNMYVEYTQISENRSLSASGGGGGCENNGTATMYVNNSSFCNNQSTELGGAVNNLANAYISNSSFTGNIAYGTYKGGAIADNASSKTMYLVNCLFGYNYYNNSSGGSAAYTLDDVHAYNGTVNLIYCTYMATSTSSGTITLFLANNLHLLAADGSTNDLFTGGFLSQITDANGALYGSNSVFRPFLVNISGIKVPTLKSGSYAIGKGCAVGYTNGSGTPVFGYKNMSTNVWTTLVGTNAASYQITNDETLLARATTPAAGAVERTVDNYAILTVNSTSNGTVSGASIYGEVYPSGTSVSVIALANSGYAFSDWTYSSGGTGTVATNPLTLTLTQNTSLTPNFVTSTNYTITYIGNNNTGGTAPAVASNSNSTNGTVSTNSGSLSRTNYTFTGWNTADNGSGTDYSPGDVYSARTNLVLYSKWSSNGVVLPVKLTRFTAASSNDNNVVLTWQTAYEINSDRFEIERSSNCDGLWVKVNTVKAAQNSSSMQTYSITDVAGSASKICYRLLQIDKDGRIEYSSIVTIVRKPVSGIELSVYPNPARNSVFVSGDISGIKDLLLYDWLGQNVSNECSVIRQSEQLYRIDISKLSPGIYILKSHSGARRLSVF